MFRFLRTRIRWRPWSWINWRPSRNAVAPGVVAPERERAGIVVYVSESEFRTMASAAAACPDRETAGFLFGLKTPNGKFVVYYATQAGPNAIRETAFCRPDLEHFKTIDERLTRDFGIRFVGRYHSHHSLGLRRPSGGDIGSATRLARRNNFDQLVELIWTTESSGAVGQAVDRVRVDAYVYTDAQNGKHVRAALQIIPNVSAFRRAVLDTNLRQLDGPVDWKRFPMERIVFDSADGDLQGGKDYDSDLAALAEQVAELPAETRRAVRAQSRDALTIVWLPHDNGREVVVAYSRCPLRPEAVYLLRTRTKERIQLTEHVLRDKRPLRLALIYEGVRSWLIHERRNESSVTPGADTIRRNPQRRRAAAQRRKKKSVD